MFATMRFDQDKNFSDLEVEPQKLEKILHAAMSAPTTGQQKPWEFLIIKSPETLSKLANLTPQAEVLREAPMAILLLGNKKMMDFPESWQKDLGNATQNLLAEAYQLGLETLKIGISPLRERMSFIREVFHLEEYLCPYALIPLGHKDGKEEQRDCYDEEKLHWEKY